MGLDLKKVKKVLVVLLLEVAEIREESKIRNYLKHKSAHPTRLSRAIPLPGMSSTPSVAASVASKAPGEMFSRRWSTSRELANSLPKLPPFSLTAPAFDGVPTVPESTVDDKEFSKDDENEIIEMAATVAGLLEVKQLIESFAPGMTTTSTTSTIATTTATGTIVTNEKIGKETAIEYLKYVLGKIDILDLLALAYLLNQQKIIDALIKELNDRLETKRPIGLAQNWSHKHIIEFFINTNNYKLFAQFLLDNSKEKIHVEVMKNAICFCIEQNKLEALKFCLRHLNLNTLQNCFPAFRDQSSADKNEINALIGLFCSIAENFGIIVVDRKNGNYGRLFEASKQNKIDYIQEWLFEVFNAYPATFSIYEQLIDQIWPLALRKPELSERKTEFLEIVHNQLAIYFFEKLLSLNPDNKSNLSSECNEAREFNSFVLGCLTILDLARLNVIYQLLHKNPEKYIASLKSNEALGDILWGDNITSKTVTVKFQELTFSKLNEYLHLLNFLEEGRSEAARNLIIKAKSLEIFSDLGSQSKLDNLAVKFNLSMSSSATVTTTASKS